MLYLLSGLCCSVYHPVFLNAHTFDQRHVICLKDHCVPCHKLVMMPSSQFHDKQLVFHVTDPSSRSRLCDLAMFHLCSLKLFSPS